MGNRGVVVFTDGEVISPAVYLHWNGSAESIYPFLNELNRRKVRADANYECARFIHIVADFFDHGEESGCLSLGVMRGPESISKTAMRQLCRTAHDNGVFVVSRTASSRNMRRFILVTNTDGQDEVMEMSPEQVADEKCAARRHRYSTPVDEMDKTIAANFDEIRHARLHARPEKVRTGGE